MILRKLSVIGYKNIREAALSFSPGINCLIGSNGMGKTNLLDAIYYLSFCRSAFTAIDSQVIGHDSDFFMLEADYEAEDGTQENVYCGMKRGVKKHFKRNKKEYRRLAEHIGLVPLIFLSPDDTQAVGGGGEERRRLMDMVVCQYDPLYGDALIRYGKALAQRNALLRQEEEPDPGLMEIWEEQMAAEGERIYRGRQAFVEELEPVFQRVYQAISGGSETVGLGYTSHCQRGALLDVIRRDRARDRAVGYSLHGIHRDDLEMTLGGWPLRREGSQGQLKTYVLALKLAQFDFLRRTATRTTPILLMDDIFDKLDAGRVEQIVRLVAGEGFGQIFITDTNRDHLDRILDHAAGDYRIFHVEQGEVSVRS